MDVGTKENQARLKVLIELEQELLEARKIMNAIHTGNAAIQTAEQRQKLLGLPRSLANLELEIQEVAQELGNVKVVNVRHGTGTPCFKRTPWISRLSDLVLLLSRCTCKRGALAVQVAMGFRYKAKWDVMQQQSNAAIRTGNLGLLKDCLNQPLMKSSRWTYWMLSGMTVR
ncbi:uncharacterized protein MELLADRAFT_66283 [Melampsora larici-populina 98AG31]|uniref:Uncharacterized protein n=1 Tax=Melampsora larici-populina (strain 98AG31 / pathotype 3-4-7) TaxID=747676 RepID=F4RYK6_MELLP|nr:uncharacterized protein MELLADRAFT_66283 [Melampsora larici-populina 98AG31]EGG02562.1 hypothetical protein MELLADRAFT_66283 [Melampsora larici-populina 98AG31]